MKPDIAMLEERLEYDRGDVDRVRRVISRPVGLKVVMKGSAEE